MDWHDDRALWVDIVATASGALVRVAGDIDLFSAGTLLKHLQSLDSPAVVDVDLSRCTHIDATGIHVLEQQRNRLAASNRLLRLVGASPKVRAELERAERHDLTATLPAAAQAG
jgi:anti-anti-sigma regulatory factor